MAANPLAFLVSLVAGVGMTGCLAVRTPAAGKPLPDMRGRALIFGRTTILDGDRVVPPANPGSDWRDTGPGLRPELTLYLLRLSPRQVARPVFAGSGYFYWFLAPGDYLLVGSPAADAGEPEVAQHHWPLAALRVLPADTLVCAGALSIEAAGAVTALEPELTMWFAAGEVRIADQCADLTAKLEARFQPTGSPPARRLLVSAADLAFNDDALFQRVRALLDAVVAGP
jgi:hypothetical protein